MIRAAAWDREAPYSHNLGFESDSHSVTAVCGETRPTLPACREIVHVYSGAVHVSRTRGCECEGEIVYEYVNEYDYAIMQPNPSRRSGLPGSSSAAVCGETSPTFSARDTDRNVYVAVCGA